MSYQVIIIPAAQDGIKKHIKAGNPKLAKKALALIDELYKTPRFGTGKPEQLKGFAVETWSRRIDSKHRLIYEIRENELVVIAISAFGHYDD